MISLPAGKRIWLAASITDIRAGMNDLAAIVESALTENPYSGHVFGVDKNDVNRTAFRIHAFLHLGDAAGTIMNPCADRRLKTENLRAFVQNSVDGGRYLPSPNFGRLVSILAQIAPERAVHSAC